MWTAESYSDGFLPIMKGHHWILGYDARYDPLAMRLDVATGPWGS